MSNNGNRNGNGQFLPGHGAPGPGRPVGSRNVPAEIRVEFWAALKRSDVRLALLTLRRIMRSKTASDKDKHAAASEVLDRAVGLPTAADLTERLDRLEELLR